MEILYVLFVYVLIYKLARTDTSSLRVYGNPDMQKVQNAFNKRYDKMIAKLGPVKGEY